MAREVSPNLLKPNRDDAEIDFVRNCVNGEEICSSESSGERCKSWEFPIVSILIIDRSLLHFLRNILLPCFFQVGACDNAQKIFKEMESNGVPPSIMTYNILLDGLCNNGKLEKALVVFEYMLKSEMELNLFTYNIIIEAMCKAGKVEESWELFCSLSLNGVKPDVVIYTTMISGLCGKRLLHKADALFTKMKEDGPLPNSGTYNTLIRAYLRDGDTAASAELIKEMRSCGFAGDASTISLVTNMLYDGRLDKSFLDMLS